MTEKEKIAQDAKDWINMTLRDMGTFKTHLMQVITVADFENLRRLSRGYPEMVRQYVAWYCGKTPDEFLKFLDGSIERTTIYREYQYDQLSEEAQKAAIKWFLGDSGNWEEWDSNDLKEDFIERLREKGWEDLEVQFSLSCCQGDGVSFTGTLSTNKLVELAPGILGDEKLDCLLGHLDDIRVFSSRGTSRYVHEKTCQIDIEWDNYGDDPIYDETVTLLEKWLEDWRAELCNELEKMGYTQMEYKASVECVEEDIRANEYTFTKEGKRI